METRCGNSNDPKKTYVTYCDSFSPKKLFFHENNLDRKNLQLILFGGSRFL